MRFLLAILLLLVVLPAHAQQSQGMSQAIVVSSCGSGALPSGAVNQLTMNQQGQLCLSGIGSSCPQATSYLGRTVGGNEGGNATNIIALICGLVTDGVWSSLDALYVFAQQNATDAVLNLVGTSYNATNVGGATFASYTGFSGWSPTKYLDTGFNPSTAPGRHFTQNSASLGLWVYAITSEGACQFGNGGCNGGGDSGTLDDFGGPWYVRLNDGAAGNVSGQGTKGLLVADRSSSTQTAPYSNGVPLAIVTSASLSPTSANMQVGTIGGTTPSTQTFSGASIGSSLGAAGNLALYTRLRTYMTAVGVP